MRRFFYLTIAAALGGGSYLVYHRVTTPSPVSRADTGGPAASAAPAPGGVHAPGPILSGDAPAEGEASGAVVVEEAEGEEPAAAEGAKPTAPVTAEGGAPPAAPASPAAPAPAAPSLSGPFLSQPEAARPPAPPAGLGPGEFEGTVRLARAAFDAGDSARGVKLLREVWKSGKDRSDVDLTSVARQLLELEERGAGDRPPPAPGAPDPEKLDLYRYLATRDTDPLWRHRACLAVGTAESRETAPESLRAAWSHLTAAHLGAPGPAERRSVMAVLDPLLKRQVFSKRFSPLVATHTVKQGESLNKIARAHATSEEAIQRLNQLTGTTIHPGQRLIILEGKPRIFVKKSEFRLWLILGERLLLDCPVGLGRDNSTPASVFTVRVRQKDPIWYRQGEPPIPAGDPRNILGSRWLGFKDTEELSGFGIHGTADPSSIGKEESSGCIRMYNRDLEVLWDFVPVGTEVVVQE